MPPWRVLNGPRQAVADSKFVHFSTSPPTVMDSQDSRRIFLPRPRDGERRAAQYTCGFLSKTGRRNKKRKKKEETKKKKKQKKKVTSPVRAPRSPVVCGVCGRTVPFFFANRALTAGCLPQSQGQRGERWKTHPPVSPSIVPFPCACWVDVSGRSLTRRSRKDPRTLLGFRVLFFGAGSSRLAPCAIDSGLHNSFWDFCGSLVLGLAKRRLTDRFQRVTRLLAVRSQFGASVALRPRTKPEFCRK